MRGSVSPEPSAMQRFTEIKVCFDVMKWLVLLPAVILLPQLPAPAAVVWGAGILEQSPAWYASPEGRTAADTVLRYQSTYGAWPKNTDLLKRPTPEALRRIEASGEANTIDNGATTLPMQF